MPGLPSVRGLLGPGCTPRACGRGRLAFGDPVFEGEGSIHESGMEMGGRVRGKLKREEKRGN